MFRKTTRLAAFAAAGFAMPALAADPDPAIDTNRDGYYSFPELQVSLPDMGAMDFTVIDTSGDGLLDMDEVAAATEAGLLALSGG